MKLQVVCADAASYVVECDMIVTDPPFEMPGETLAKILAHQKANHLLLITTMKQLIAFCRAALSWNISFDFVLDQSVPKQSKSIRQPHYTHSTGVYMTRNSAPSLFHRKLRARSDTFDGKGYWPTIIQAPRNRMQQRSYAKNVKALTDVIGSFNVSTVADLFAGSGTTALAAFELGLDCILVEKNSTLVEQIIREFKFFGVETN